MKESLQKKLNIIEVIQQGSKFTSFLDKIYFESLLNSSEKHLVRNIAESYTTDKRMYQTRFFKEYVAEEDDVTLQVTQHNSDA